MKKVLFLIAVASLLSACGGGGSGGGTAIGQPPVGGVAGSGDSFVSAVYAVVLSSNSNDNVDTYSMYDTVSVTSDDNTAPDSIPM